MAKAREHQLMDVIVEQLQKAKAPADHLLWMMLAMLWNPVALQKILGMINRDDQEDKQSCFWVVSSAYLSGRLKLTNAQVNRYRTIARHAAQNADERNLATASLINFGESSALERAAQDFIDKRFEEKIYLKALMRWTPTVVERHSDLLFNESNLQQLLSLLQVFALSNPQRRERVKTFLWKQLNRSDLLTDDVLLSLIIGTYTAVVPNLKQEAAFQNQIAKIVQTHPDSLYLFDARILLAMLRGNVTAVNQLFPRNNVSIAGTRIVLLSYLGQKTYTDRLLEALSIVSPELDDVHYRMNVLLDYSRYLNETAHRDRWLNQWTPGIKQGIKTLRSSSRKENTFYRSPWVEAQFLSETSYLRQWYSYWLMADPVGGVKEISALYPIVRSDSVWANLLDINPILQPTSSFYR